MGIEGVAIESLVGRRQRGRHLEREDLLAEALGGDHLGVRLGEHDPEAARIEITFHASILPERRVAPACGCYRRAVFA
jgi:hypothetical protein